MRTLWPALARAIQPNQDDEFGEITIFFRSAFLLFLARVPTNNTRCTSFNRDDWTSNKSKLESRIENQPKMYDMSAKKTKERREKNI